MAEGGFESRMRAWLDGRNGADELATFMIICALVVVIANIFLNTVFLSVLALALMLYAWWRMSSKNVEARMRENRAFAELMGPVRPWLKNPGRSISEARSYKHLRCPSCSQRMRVPRHKGRLRVRCPKCKATFEART